MQALFQHKDKGENRTTTTTPQADTILGASIVLEGALNSDGDIIVHGQVNGSIETKAQLTIGKDATVKADLVASRVYIQGTVHGNIRSQDIVELSASAKVYGNVESKQISVEAGALLQGQCTVGAQSPQPATTTAATQHAGQSETAQHTA